MLEREVVCGRGERARQFRAVWMSWIDNQPAVARLDDAIHCLDGNHANERLICEHVGIRGAAAVREVDPDRSDHWNIDARGIGNLDPCRMHLCGVESELPGNGSRQSA